MSFIRVTEGELQVGQPLRWALYDDSHNQMLAQGEILETQSQINFLFERNLFRKDERSKGAGESSGKVGEGPREEVRTLEEIKLAVGDTLQMQSQGDQGRYYVKMIGYLRNRGLVVSTPTSEGKVMLMREGQSFIVRLFSGQSVYAFPTSILKVANVPYPHLHLAYPAQVKGLVVRRGARVKVNIIAAVHNRSGQPQAACITNLSTGGAALDAKTTLGRKDEEILIKFRVAINGVDQYLSIQTVIRGIHVGPAEEGQTALMQHGVQFINVPHAEHVSLAAYVYQKLFEEAADA